MTLFKCSKCQSNMTVEHFDVNRKGERKKCCKFCLAKYECNKCNKVFSKMKLIITHECIPS